MQDSGGFAPLEKVSPDKHVTLGLITTKKRNWKIRIRFWQVKSPLVDDIFGSKHLLMRSMAAHVEIESVIPHGGN